MFRKLCSAKLLRPGYSGVEEYRRGLERDRRKDEAGTVGILILEGLLCPQL